MQHVIWLSCTCENSDINPQRRKKSTLPQESQLDRLRDNIPRQAAKALFGVCEMTKAWKLLESLYGDKNLIANKLKSQLKNLKSESEGIA